MSEMAAMERAQDSTAPEREVRADPGRDWALAAAFFCVVLALYAAIGFAIYSVVF